MRTSKTSGRARHLAPVALLAVLALVATACSSSGSKSGGSSGGNSAPASTPAGSAGSSGGGSTSSGVAAAKAATLKNEMAPTTIPITTPLKSKPPTGKTFVFLHCTDVNQCTDEGDGYKAAIKILGWNYKELSYKSSDPGTLVSAMMQALQYKPVAVAMSGLPRAVWESVVPAYRKANVKILTMYLGPTQYDDTVIGQVGGPSDVQAYGEIIGNWVVADSNGKAHILLQEVNDFPILKDYVTGFKRAVKENCPDCKITELNNTIAQLGGQIVPSVVSALQKDKSINYVSTVNGPFLAGLPSALAAAGLAGKVKICGESGDVANLTNVKSGKEGAYTGLALHYASFSAIDMLLRNMQGLPYEKDGNGGSPKQLLVQGGDFAISNSYDKPADYADQFKKLWLES